MRYLLPMVLMIAATPSTAATPAAYAALDRASEAACRTASGLRDATVGEPTRFSDAWLIDVRTVVGTWPQKHMKGARATMLCLYNRRTKRAEVQEAATPAPAALRDIVWRVTMIEGRRPVGPDPLTLRLGSNGEMSGSTGCNGFQGAYVLAGTRLTVPRPLIATQRGCGGTIGAQERRYLERLAQAVRAEPGPAGSLVVTTRDGATLRYTPAPKG